MQHIPVLHPFGARVIQRNDPVKNCSWQFFRTVLACEDDTLYMCAEHSVLFDGFYSRHPAFHPSGHVPRKRAHVQI